MSDPKIGSVKSDHALSKEGALGSDRPGDFSLDTDRRSIADAFHGYIGRFRTGDPGALPAVLGLVVLVVIFSQVSGLFLSKYNIGVLPNQGAYIAIIGLGLVFVLLLGEIDLSAGTTGGMCAGFAAEAIVSKNLKSSIEGGIFWGLIVFMIAAVLLGVWLKAYSAAVAVVVGLILLLTNLDKHVVLALLAAVCIGTAVGVVNGWLVARVGVPSFIVTLAFFLAWQGVLLFAVNSESISVSGYSFWNGLTQNNLSTVWSWVFTAVVVIGYLLWTLFNSLSNQRRGLSADRLSLVLLRAGAIAVVGVVVTIFANQNRGTPDAPSSGLPWALVIPIALFIVSTIALTKTTWGRHLFATGGNTEAARRAGIDVVHIRVTAFVLCSTFGALGGVFLASSTYAVSLGLGAGNILLFSVAAAVIGGTSLFGGRGKPRDALIGALVIVIIPNGLGLRPSIPPQWQEIITGAVLLIAASVDAVSRRRSRTR